MIQELIFEIIWEILQDVSLGKSAWKSVLEIIWEILQEVSQHAIYFEPVNALRPIRRIKLVNACRKHSTTMYISTGYAPAS